jgi:hypothetical protein
MLPERRSIHSEFIAYRLAKLGVGRLAVKLLCENASHLLYLLVHFVFGNRYSVSFRRLHCKPLVNQVIKHLKPFRLAESAACCLLKPFYFGTQLFDRDYFASYQVDRSRRLQIALGKT